MVYYSRGGVRDGVGRFFKVFIKIIRIEENLVDKIKKLMIKLEFNYILSKWESLENFLLYN